METSIALFTRNLRVHDNPVLYAATRVERCVPLFVVDDTITRSPFMAPNRAAFLADCLADLDRGLKDRGGNLCIRQGDLVDEVMTLVRQHDVREVHVAADVSKFSQRREHRLSAALREVGAELRVHDTTVTAVEPLTLVPTGGKDHFAVFTPYFRKWQGVSRRSTLRAPRTVIAPRLQAEKVPSARQLCHGSASPDVPRGGESEARKLMIRWIRSGVSGYAEGHDLLAEDATSHLSPHLHFGTVSSIELLQRVGIGSEGARAFTRQLAWRDFHHQVLAARPECSTQDYRPHGDRWRRSEKDLRTWRDGRTGYPIVDAAMRQLASEGWMHNRGRLIVASFLTKTLYVDWRVGAQHFADLLVDCDVANNQMNWQWVAGTGTDTRPNRVLNPITQARRYDPDGDYVRRYLPELAEVAGGRVHEPWKLPDDERRRLDYPGPMVDLREGSRCFLAARGK